METTTPNASNLKQGQLEPTLINASSIPQRGFLQNFNAVNTDGKPSAILLDDASGMPASIVAEKSVPASTDSIFFKHEIKPKRFAISADFSEKLMRNATSDYREYIKNSLVKRVIAGIETQIAKSGGTGTTQIGVISQGGHGASFNSANQNGAIEFSVVQYTLNQFLTNQFNKKADAFWMFHEFPKVTDTNGNSYVTYDNLPEGAVARVLGIPAYITPLYSTTGKQIAAVIVNPDAYALSMSDIKITEEFDNKKKMHTFLAECWVDGKIVVDFGRYGIEYAPQV